MNGKMETKLAFSTVGERSQTSTGHNLHVYRQELYTLILVYRALNCLKDDKRLESYNLERFALNNIQFFIEGPYFLLMLESNSRENSLNLKSWRQERPECGGKGK